MDTDMDDTDTEMNGADVVEADTGTMSDEAKLVMMSDDAYATFGAFVRLITDPKAAKRTARELRNAAAAVAAARQELDAARIEQEARWAADRAEIEAERAALRKRQLDVAAAEASIKQRQGVIGNLERAWSDLALPGEPPPMTGTLGRARPFSGLQVARHFAENGSLPDHPDAPLESDSVRYAADGSEFPKNISLRRQASDSDAATGVRVRTRGRRNAAATENSNA
jgi:hypothetical protein